MKARNTFLALVCAAGGSMILPSLEARPEAHAYLVTSVSGRLAINVGTRESEVREQFGLPDRELNDHVQAYFGFRLSAPTDPHRCDILLLTVEKGRVADIKLINSRGLDVLTKRSDRGDTNLAAAFVPAVGKLAKAGGPTELASDGAAK